MRYRDCGAAHKCCPHCFVFNIVRWRGKVERHTGGKGKRLNRAFIKRCRFKIISACRLKHLNQSLGPHLARLSLGRPGLNQNLSLLGGLSFHTQHQDSCGAGFQSLPPFKKSHSAFGIGCKSRFGAKTGTCSFEVRPHFDIGLGFGRSGVGRWNSLY